MKINKEQLLGLLREVLTAFGGLVFATTTGWESITGLILAIASIIWSVWQHEGLEVIFTSIRKAISLVPAIFVMLGWISPEKAGILISMLAPLTSIIWSITTNGPAPTNDGRFPLWILCLFTLFINSCGINFTEDGCILAQYNKNGKIYQAGPCVGPDMDKDGNADVNRFRVVWSNDDKQTIRATYWTDKKKPVLIEYLTGDVWIKWTSKSGVIIGPVPAEVDKALQGNPEPIEKPVIPLALPSAAVLEPSQPKQ